MTLGICSAGSAESRLFQLTQLAQVARKSCQKTWWMVLFFWLLAAVPAQAQVLLRVAIEQDASQVKIGSSTDAALLDASGKAIQTIPGMNAVMATQQGNQVGINNLQAVQFCIQPSDGGFVFIGEAWYRGSTCILHTGDGLTAVNYVDLEQYLYSVVGSEMPDGWSLEALKAQAVAARSYVLYQRQNSANAIFDVGDTTAWQVYGGVQEETASTRAAVDATQDQVLIYGQQGIIDAVFHACAGGYTENVEDVWSSPLPYLRAVPSPDANITECQWTQMFTAQELSQKLGYTGTIARVVAGYDDRHRISSLSIEGSTGSVTMSGREVRRALGVRSTLFTLEPVRGRVATTGNLPASPSSFQLIGRGNGHGIGMSQWGAKVFADQGYNYAQILSHYYTGATLAVIEVE